jgi:osmoprotectant transport system ATP-binding protein
MSVALEADGLHHAFGTVRALDDVHVQVRAGQVLAVVGESGSGKSTLLRTFNRLVEPDRGAVHIRGVDVREIDAVVLRRSIGYVPQNGGLLPHWRVLRNVALVPRLAGHADPDRAAREALRLVELDPAVFAARFPHELSGGQRQRVALARALAAQQDIVLLDEPFGALDAISRRTLQDAFDRIRRDVVEAARLADRVAVMRAGRIEQVDTIEALRDASGTAYVRELMEQAALSASVDSRSATSDA